MMIELLVLVQGGGLRMVGTSANVFLKGPHCVLELLVLFPEQLVFVFGLLFFLPSGVPGSLGGGIVFLSSKPVLLVLDDAAAALVSAAAIAFAPRRAGRLDAEI